MAVKWRKETFYTILTINGKMEAFRENGFSDGQYNYYEQSDGKWFAVLPGCGLSIASGNTRTKCRNAALKVDIPLESKMSKLQRERYSEAKRLISEKTVMWL